VPIAPLTRPSLLRLPCPVPPISQSRMWEDLVMVCQPMSTSRKNMALIRGATLNIVTSRCYARGTQRVSHPAGSAGGGAG